MKRHVPAPRPFIALLVCAIACMSIGPAEGRAMPSDALHLSDSQAASAVLQPPAPADFDGDDILIAVIGSGIDYTHLTLGGSGAVEDFEANDPTMIEPDSFPAGVVVGGYDFAGALYTSACPDPVPADVECSSMPVPDDDPLDRVNGLGTAIAGIALEAAPAARIVALKIYGEPDGVAAESVLHAQALDWVLRHNRGEDVPGTAPDGRIDVVLDSGGGGAWSARRTELNAAVYRLAEDGVTVVTPAGDDGPTPFIVGGVGATDYALSVAAVIGQGETTWGIQTRWIDDAGAPMVQDHDAIDASAPFGTVAASEPITAPLAWYGLACTETEGEIPPPAQDVTERIALIERGTCSFVDKVLNAEASGAIAAVLFSDTRAKTSPRGGGGTAPAIPSAMIDREPGLAIQALLEAGTEVSATLDADHTFRKTWLDGTLLQSASRGPDRRRGIGPSLAAEGVDVPAPAAGRGDAMTSRSGSSMAAASVAGAAARLHQRFADYVGVKPGDEATVLTNTADPIVFVGRNDTGSLAPVALQGAGALNIGAALETTLILRADGSRRDLGFEVLRVDSGSIVTRRGVEYSNIGTSPRSIVLGFHHAFPAEDLDAGIEVPARDEPLEIAPGATISDVIKLRTNPADMSPWTLADGNPIDDPGAFGTHEVDGWFVVGDASGPAGSTAARLPLSILPRISSLIEPDGTSPMPLHLDHPGAVGTVGWTNTGAAAGRVIPAVGVGRDLRESGPRAPLPPSLDILDVAIRTGLDPNAAEGDPAEMMIEWRIATAGTRLMPAGNTFDVLLDLDQDGEIDRVVTSARGPEARRGLSGDEWYAVVTYPKPGSLGPDFSRMAPNPIPIEWDIDDATMVLRARAVELVLDVESGDERFWFGVRSRDPLMTSLLPGEEPVMDLAPDDLATGGMFTFDQRVHACYRFGFEGEGDGAGGLTGLGAAGEVQIAAGERAVVEVSETCGLDTPGAGSLPDVLFFLPDNGDTAWGRAKSESRLMRWAVSRESGSGPLIYLPFGSGGDR